MRETELLLNVLQSKKTYCPAWIPFSGGHSASLIEVNADEYLQIADLIEKGVIKAVKLYKPDGIPVVFNLQIEAELLACKLKWAEKTPSSAVSYPLANGLNYWRFLPILMHPMGAYLLFLRQLGSCLIK